MATIPKRNHRLICPAAAGQVCGMPSGHAVNIDNDGISDPVSRMDAEEMATVNGWNIFEKPDVEEDEDVDVEEEVVPDLVPGHIVRAMQEEILTLKHTIAGVEMERDQACAAKAEVEKSAGGDSHTLGQYKVSLDRAVQLLDKARIFAHSIRQMVGAPDPAEDEDLFTVIPHYYPGTQSLIDSLKAGIVVNDAGKVVGAVAEADDFFGDDDEPSGDPVEDVKPNGTRRKKSG